MKKKLIIIVGVLAVLMLIGSCANKNPGTTNNNTSQPTDTNEPAKSTQTPSTQFPENKFDATVAVPGTNLIFAYPSKGFYGLGAVVKPIQPGDPNG